MNWVSITIALMSYKNCEADYEQFVENITLDIGLGSEEVRAETQLNATRGIDTFSEPFEDDEESSNWLLAAGIAGVFALGAWLLPKGD